MKNLQQTTIAILLVLFCLLSISAQAQELRQAALEKGVKFGSPLFNLYDQPYQQLFRDQINIGTIPAYWKYTTHNQEGQYTWAEMDAAMAFGEQNGWELHGHPLVWGSDTHIPDWVKGKPLADAESIMLDHIRTVAGRYGNRITTWDVVNEAIEDDGTYRDCYWNRGMTGEFIAKAFVEAKAVVPNAVLLYNDYGIEANAAKFNTVKSMLGWIQSLGAPVDGLGWQLHTDVNTVLDPNFQLEQYMLDISNMGLTNYVTELDIRMPANTPFWLEQQQLAYRKIAEIFQCNPTKGDYFQCWDISDKHTWWNDFQPQNAPFFPLPFDVNLNKKPAYWGLVDGFRSAACDEMCKVPTPPTIDGVGSDWTQTGYNIETNVLGTPSNAADLSGNVQLTWDDNYLYVFGAINDDALVNDSGGAAYEDDGFEIYLDGGNDRSFSYDANDHHLLFRVNDPNVFYWSIQTQNPAGVDFSRVITQTGYNIEVRIAWSFIGVTPFPGMDLGVDFHLNDDDDGGIRDHKTSWFAREDQAWNNTSLFNTLQLTDQQCIISTIRTVNCAPSLYLEGPYSPNTGLMRNTLLQSNLLPAGQPYNAAPWNYQGLEGAGWSSNDYPAGAVDWVLISLRTSPAAGDEIARFASILLQDGTTSPLATVEVSPTITSVYVVVEHRNHLPAMSDGLVPIVNNALNYDFRNKNSYTGTSGFGQKQVSGSWALYTGNADQSNLQGYEITGADRVLWQVQNGNFGLYNNTDFNLDSDVNGNDRVQWSMNNGISSTIPR